LQTIEKIPAGLGKEVVGEIARIKTASPSAYFGEAVEIVGVKRSRLEKK